MPNQYKIACLQTCPRPNFEAALDEAIPLLEEAVSNEANVIALPEYCGGLSSKGPRISPPAANEDSHPVLRELKHFAKQRNVWLLIGSLAIEESIGSIWNRSFLINRQGDIVSRYNKIHMFDIQLSDTHTYKESDTICPGTSAVISRTEYGIFGLSICYDLRFPTYYRCLSQAGAQILLIPAAFTKKTGEAHWHILNRARAIENSAYVVSPCAVGPVTGGGECYGHSLIIDPWGKILADGGNGESKVISVDIDLDKVKVARNKIPSLQHDKNYRLFMQPSGMVYPCD